MALGLAVCYDLQTLLSPEAAPRLSTGRPGGDFPVACSYPTCTVVVVFPSLWASLTSFSSAFPPQSRKWRRDEYLQGWAPFLPLFLPFACDLGTSVGNPVQALCSTAHAPAPGPVVTH